MAPLFRESSKTTTTLGSLLLQIRQQNSNWSTSSQCSVFKSGSLSAMLLKNNCFQSSEVVHKASLAATSESQMAEMGEKDAKTAKTVLLQKCANDTLNVLQVSREIANPIIRLRRYLAIMAIPIFFMNPTVGIFAFSTKILFTSLGLCVFEDFFFARRQISTALGYFENLLFSINIQTTWDDLMGQYRTNEPGDWQLRLINAILDHITEKGQVIMASAFDLLPENIKNGTNVKQFYTYICKITLQRICEEALQKEDLRDLKYQHVLNVFLEQESLGIAINESITNGNFFIRNILVYLISALIECFRSCHMEHQIRRKMLESQLIDSQSNINWPNMLNNPAIWPALENGYHTSDNDLEKIKKATQENTQFIGKWDSDLNATTVTIDADNLQKLKHSQEPTTLLQEIRIQFLNFLKITVGTISVTILIVYGFKIFIKYLLG